MERAESAVELPAGAKGAQRGAPVEASAERGRSSRRERG